MELKYQNLLYKKIKFNKANNPENIFFMIIFYFIIKISRKLQEFTKSTNLSIHSFNHIRNKMRIVENACVISILFFIYGFNLNGFEYKTEGILEDVFQERITNTHPFSAYVKDNKWYLTNILYVPIIHGLEYYFIKAGYDGKYTYYIFESYMKNGANFTNAVVSCIPVFGSSLYSGSAAIWLSQCSYYYFMNLKTNYIYPIILNFLMDSDKYKEKPILAKMKYLSDNNRLLIYLEYQDEKGKIYYNVDDYTNINDVYIPIKTRAFDIVLGPGQKAAYTNHIFTVTVTSINSVCEIKEFIPKFNGSIHIGDERYICNSNLPVYIHYYATNWLTDEEFYKHPAFIQESNRLREMKIKSSMYENRSRNGRIIFFSLLIIATAPFLYFVLRKIIKR